MHPEKRRKVWAAIDLLRGEPLQGRALRDELDAYWRLPVGQLRIVYRFSARELEIAAIGERATIYEDLARRSRR